MHLDTSSFKNQTPSHRWTLDPCPGSTTPVLIYSHFEAISAASVTDLIALHLQAPVMPRALYARQRDWSPNP